MSLETFKKLYSLLNNHTLNFIRESGKIEVVCGSPVAQDNLKVTLLADFNIPSDKYPPDRLRISLDNSKYWFYWDLDEFKVQSFSNNPDNFQRRFDKDIFIWNFQSENQFETESLYYESSTQKTFLSFKEQQNFWLFENGLYYLKFLHFLKSQENIEDGKYHFVDYFSWDKRQMILVSAKKEGKMTISFPNEIIYFDPDLELKPRFEDFFSAFKNLDANNVLPKFIKAELFNFLSVEPRSNRMNSLIYKMPEILNIAHQNFDVYISDLSIENVRREYLETKDKYFAQTQEVLGKLATQVIGLPVSISAVALATYAFPQNSESNLLGWILIGVFIIYTTFSLFLLRIQRDGIDDIREQYDYDFEKLDKSEFFTKYIEEKGRFEIIKFKVLNKIKSLQVALYIYIILQLVTSGVFLYKLFSLVDFYPAISVIVAEIFFFIFPKSKISKNWF